MGASNQKIQDSLKIVPADWTTLKEHNGVEILKNVKESYEAEMQLIALDPARTLDK
jgi:hypothetical protein